jgi:phage-related protein
MKEIVWLAQSRKDLDKCPRGVIDEVVFALELAKDGYKGENAKPLKGFGSAKVLEVIVNNDGNTFRAVYTVKFKAAIYVLHVFQKKSKQGTATPKRDMELISARLKRAEEDYRTRY